MRLILYRDAGSWLHRADPRAKFLSQCAFAVALFLVSDPVWLAAGFLLVALCAASARVFRPYLFGAFLVVVVGGLSFLVWPIVLTLRGQGGPSAWWYGLSMGLRLSTMLLGGYLFLLVTRPEEILAAFEGLGMPYPMVFTIGLTLRLVPTLLAAANHVVEAQRLRGLRFDEGSPLTRARRYVPLLIPILAGTLRGATRMAWALEAKGFGSPRPRVPYLQLKMNLVDRLLLAVSLILMGAIGWAWHLGKGRLAGF